MGTFSGRELYLEAKARWGTGLGLEQGLLLGHQQVCGRTDLKSGVLSPSLVTQAPESLEEKVLVEKLSSEETEFFFSPKTKMKTETKPAPPTVSKSRQWWENVDRKLHGWHPGKDWPPASLSEP